jgi:hypothetical protein
MRDSMGPARLQAARRWRAAPLLIPTLAAAPACSPGDPRRDLRISGVEGYYSVDRPAGGEQYIAPTVRFTVESATGRPLRSVQASASYFLVGDAQAWIGAFSLVATRNQPLLPGRPAVVTLRPEGEGRYHSPVASPEQMFEDRRFRDVTVKVYLRVGSSPPVMLLEAPIERRIGSHAAELPPPP